MIEVLILLIALYFTVKWAVKNGINESKLFAKEEIYEYNPDGLRANEYMAFCEANEIEEESFEVDDSFNENERVEDNKREN